MQMRDPGVGRRAGQVDFRLDAARRAAPADTHLRALEPEPALRAVSRKLDDSGVGSARSHDTVEVSAIGGTYYGPDGFMQLTGYPIVVASSTRSQNREAQRRLWVESEQLTGVTYPV